MLNFIKQKSYLVIIIVGLILYAGTIFFDFSYFDDNALILDNYQIISNPANFGKLFTNDVFFSDSNFYYRPLLNVSLMFDAQISNIYPWFYHLSNVLLHILTAVLLLIVLQKLGAKKIRALWLSLFFLVHPALVQAVAWIPGRNDSLLAVFMLSCFLFFLKFLESPRVFNYLMSLLFFILALFTKEAAVIIPVIFTIYYLLLSDKKIKKADIFMFIFGGLAVLFFWIMMRRLAIDGELGGLWSVIVSFVYNAPAVLIALGKFLFPFNLSIMPILKETSAWYGILAVVIFTFLSLTKKIKKTWLMFGLTWFLLFLLPSFVSPNPEEFHYLLLLEHRLYLPFLGLIFIFINFNLFNTNTTQGIKFKKIVNIFPVIVLIIFIIISFNHLPNFKDRLSFWEFATSKSESNSFAYNNLGAMLYLESRINEAEEIYKKALQINPNTKMAYNNLGVIYLDRREFDLAEEVLKKELEINPGYDRALYNLEYLHLLRSQIK